MGSGTLKTHDDFIKEIFILVKDEYHVVGEYINSKTKITIKHNICNNEFDVYPPSFLGTKNRKGTRCPFCFGTPRKTTEQFMKEIFELVGNEYELLGEYRGNKIHISMRHNICGTEYEVKPSNFLSGKRCPICMRPNYNRDTIKFKEEVYKLTGDQYKVLDEYIGVENKILLKHNIDNCNNVFLMKPCKFLLGQRCPKCYGTQRKTIEEFKREVFELVENEYDILGEYKNAKTKILIKHNSNNCNNSCFEMIPDAFLNGQRCPICSESHGEQRIRKYLENNNIDFQKEFIFDDLKGLGNGLLRFDFAIRDSSNKLSYIIEYDGEFHYFPILGEDHLLYQQCHDEMKNKYCKDHNIPLLRIPYWDFDNIEEILNKQTCY